MRFGRPPKPDPSLKPLTQFRLFRLVMLLGLVFIGVQWASQEEHWKWLVASQSQPPPLPSLAKLEFQVKSDPVHSSLAAGEVRIAPPDSDERSAPEASIAHLPTEIPANWLAGMDDERLGLLRSEQASIDQVLDQVRSLSNAALDTAAARDVGFVTLNDRPTHYRGKLLGFTGILWKLSLYEGGEQTLNKAPVYDAWLYTPDAANNPTRVLFTELPSSLKLGERLDQPIQFAGYFIKRYGYATAGGTHVAPLFVARTLMPRPVTTTTAAAKVEPNGSRWLAGLLVSCVASGFLIWKLSHDERPSRSRDLPAQLPYLNASTDTGVAAQPDFDNNPSA